MSTTRARAMSEARNSDVSARFRQRLAFAAADAILEGHEVVWQERAEGRPALGEPFGNSAIVRLLGRAIDEVHGPGPVSFFSPYDGTGRVEARREGALLFEGFEPEFERGRLELRSRYVKLPANVVTDPMFAGLPAAAWRMHWEVACSCVLQLNNGRFQTEQLRFLTRVSPRENTIRSLIDRGLWKRDGDDYVLVGFEISQLTREDVDKFRQAGRRGGVASAQANAQANAQASPEADKTNRPKLSEALDRQTDPSESSKDQVSLSEEASQSGGSGLSAATPVSCFVVGQDLRDEALRERPDLTPTQVDASATKFQERVRAGEVRDPAAAWLGWIKAERAGPATPAPPPANTAGHKTGCTCFKCHYRPT